MAFMAVIAKSKEGSLSFKHAIKKEGSKDALFVTDIILQDKGALAMTIAEDLAVVLKAQYPVVEPEECVEVKLIEKFFKARNSLTISLDIRIAEKCTILGFIKAAETQELSGFLGYPFRFIYLPDGVAPPDATQPECYILVNYAQMKVMHGTDFDPRAFINFSYYGPHTFSGKLSPAFMNSALEVLASRRPIPLVPAMPASTSPARAGAGGRMTPAFGSLSFSEDEDDDAAATSRVGTNTMPSIRG